MEPTARVIHIGPPFYGFVRVNLESGESFQTRLTDLQCRDIRVGDTITWQGDALATRVLLEQRPAKATPYTF